MPKTLQTRTSSACVTGHRHRLNGVRRADYRASRRRLGVRERVFLQSTPQGDLVLVTLEGADPAGAIAQIGADDDDFARWFIGQLKEIHAVDLRADPQGPLPELISDTES